MCSCSCVPTAGQYFSGACLNFLKVQFFIPVPKRQCSSAGVIHLLATHSESSSEIVTSYHSSFAFIITFLSFLFKSIDALNIFSFSFCTVRDADGKVGVYDFCHSVCFFANIAERSL